MRLLCRRETVTFPASEMPIGLTAVYWMRYPPLIVRVEGLALYAQDTRIEVALAGVAFIDVRALGAGGAMFSDNGSTHNTEALDVSRR